MELTVWKFTVALESLRSDRFEIEMPRGAVLLHVDQDVAPGGGLVAALWALVDKTAPQVPRSLIVHGTGHDAGDVEGLPFLGTVVLRQLFIPLVFHFWDGGEA